MRGRRDKRRRRASLGEGRLDGDGDGLLFLCGCTALLGFGAESKGIREMPLSESFPSLQSQTSSSSFSGKVAGAA